MSYPSLGGFARSPSEGCRQHVYEPHLVQRLAGVVSNHKCVWGGVVTAEFDRVNEEVSRAPFRVLLSRREGFKF